MRVLEKNNIRGFNLLELLVVIVIISIISAGAYPSFSSWKKEREVRVAATKIRNLFTSINSQVQNGSFAFAQVEVTTQFDDSLAIISKGLNMDTLTQRIRNVAGWNSDYEVRCDADQTGSEYTGLQEGWDEEGAIRDGNNWSVSNNLQVSFLSFDDITVDFDGKKSGTICFSKDGTWYSADGEFRDEQTAIEILYICNATSTITSCDVPPSANPKPEYPIPNAKHEYVFELSWSRFGNINMEKWDDNRSKWVAQQ